MEYNKIVLLIRYLWDLSSAGRASALQAEGHRFKSYRSHWCRRGGIGRRTGLKILRDLTSRTGSIPVAGIILLMNSYTCELLTVHIVLFEV